MDAYSFAFPKESNTITTGNAHEPRLLWITYSDFTGINTVAILCSHSSTSFYLRYGDSNEQLWIMKWESKMIIGHIMCTIPS